METPLAGLTFTRFRVGYKVVERAAFPSQKGPLFRHGLLTDLRNAACTGTSDPCPLSLLASTGPLPFVYVPPDDDRTRLLAGDALKASLVMAGRAAAHVACMIHGLDRHVRRGLGPDRCRVLLEQVDWLDPRDRLWTRFYFSREQELRSEPVAFDAAQIEARAALLRGRTRITLRFGTPLRLAGPLTAESLLDALAARLAALGEHWGTRCDTPFPPRSPITLLTADLTEHARPRRVSEWRGSLTLSGPLDEWLAPLVAGQHLHLGVGAAMGYGAYTLSP